MKVRSVLLLSVVALSASICGLTRNPTTTPTTQPATRTPTVEKYPSDQLVAASRSEGQKLKERLGDKFNMVVSPPFVVAGDLSLQRLKAYAQWSVVCPGQAMWVSYFPKKPDKVITILLFADEKSYRREAKRLLGDDNLPHFGYYKPTERTLVMNIATGTGTLVHELTHALIVYDFPDVPVWFNEGLASLHEQCIVREDEIIGMVNWRLPALQQAISQGKLRPLQELVSNKDFHGSQLALNYAHARYFCMYMQKRGLLKKFYACFRDHHTGSGAGVKAVEKVFGKDIEAVEKDFIRWVMKLEFR
jgi:hypothetical protein